MALAIFVFSKHRNKKVALHECPAGLAAESKIAGQRAFRSEPDIRLPRNAENASNIDLIEMEMVDEPRR